MTLPKVDGYNVALATLFDSGYFARGQTMIESARLSSSSGTFVLALDERVSKLLESKVNVSVFEREEIEASSISLSHVLQARSRAEQIFTINPSFLRTVIKNVSPNGWLVYADADIEFQIPLEEYLKDFDQASVIITPHRHYPWNKRRLAKYGEFNVGVVAFRNDVNGLRALEYWAESCIDWCRDVPEAGKYADQKYLEDFSGITQGVVIDDREGVNQAPWNTRFWHLTSRRSSMDEDSGVLYFHMQGLRRFKNRWQLGHLQYLGIAGPRLKSRLYLPYLAKLERAQNALEPGMGHASVRHARSFLRRLVHTASFSVALVLGQTISQRTIRRYIAKNPLE